MKTEDRTATHRQLVKLAHQVLREHPREQDLGELGDLLKRRCAAVRITFADSTQIARAVDSAIWQRRHL